MKQYLIKSRYASVFEAGRTPRLFNFYRIYGAHDPDVRCVHVHENALELGIVIRGFCVSIVDGRSYILKEGDILAVNAGISHEQNFGLTPDLEYYSIGIKNLHVHGLRENALIPEGMHPVLQFPEACREAETLFKLVSQQLTYADDFAIETANHLMLSALSILLRQIRPFSQGSAAGQPFAAHEHIAQELCHYLDEHYRDDISLDNMASALNLNKYYMTRAFKKAIGYPPIQYLLRRRIGEAQFLLVETGKTISDIASDVGFKTPGQFSRTFSNILNTTPTRYRKEVLTRYTEETV
ncbi:MAG: AraC family transcriptional regulator [Eubacterium sp.]|nr:AraC family transcriptional regulator [Eubacterium sp.]